MVGVTVRETTKGQTSSGQLKGHCKGHGASLLLSHL